jgi:hypothetical protein
MKETRTPPMACLDCGKVLVTAACIDGDARPRPGDITICLNCGHLMAFGEGLRVRSLTDAEIVDVAGDRTVVVALQARAAIDRLRP